MLAAFGPAAENTVETKGGGGPESLSLIVNTAVDGDPRPAPVGLLKIRFTVSSPSGIASSTIKTENVLLDSPAAKLKVPVVADSGVEVQRVYVSSADAVAEGQSPQSLYFNRLTALIVESSKEYAGI